LYWDGYKTYSPLSKYYIPPSGYYAFDGYYSDTYQLEYYDGYGYNFYSGKYGYYEYSCEPVNYAAYSISDYIWSTLALVIGSAASFLYWNKTKKNAVAVFCCFPWGLTGLLGVAIVAPFVIVFFVFKFLGMGCLIFLDKCANIAGNVTIDLRPPTPPQEININYNSTTINTTNISNTTNINMGGGYQMGGGMTPGPAGMNGMAPTPGQMMPGYGQTMPMMDPNMPPMDPNMPPMDPNMTMPPMGVGNQVVPGQFQGAPTPGTQPGPPV